MNGRLESLLLRRIAAESQQHVAAAMGISASHMNRITSGESGVLLEKLEALLAALGLAVVEMEGESVTVSRERYHALEVLARDGLTICAHCPERRGQ